MELSTLPSLPLLDLGETANSAEEPGRQHDLWPPQNLTFPSAVPQPAQRKKRPTATNNRASGSLPSLNRNFWMYEIDPEFLKRKLEAEARLQHQIKNARMKAQREKKIILAKQIDESHAEEKKEPKKKRKNADWREKLKKQLRKPPHR